MAKNLLILGGGIMQVPALRIAKEKGHRVVVFDGREDVPARSEADWFYQADISSLDICVRTARQHAQTYGLDGVMTLGTDFSTTVAKIAQELGLPGIPYENALLAKDKGLMRRCLESAGVPIPWYRVVEKNDLFPDPENFSYPLVVKPSDNMGARGVKLVSFAEDLHQGFLEARSQSGTGRVVIEGYMNGPEFSLDAIVRDGEIRLTGFADRHIFYPPYFIELGHSFPSSASQEVKEGITRTFFDGIRALGITHGAAKGDIKWTSRGPMVGEIAARLSGGFMSGWTYPASSGRSSILWAIENALGLPLSSQSLELSHGVVERAFISPPGKIQTIIGLEEASASPGVMNLFSLVSPGQRVKFPISNVEKCGNIIVKASDRGSAEILADQARRKILLRLTPGDSETEAFFSDTQDKRAWFFSDSKELSVQGASLKELFSDMKGFTGYSGSLGSELERFILKGGVAGGVYWFDTRRSGQ